MRAYDNNNYYGYNNNSMTPSGSSSGSRISHYGGSGSGSGGGQEYMSNVSSTPQSSDAEMDYHTLSASRSRRLESTANQPRVPSGSFTVIGSMKNNNNGDDNQHVNINYPAKVNIRLAPPDVAPQSYRVTQSKRNHRNKSFSIMTELPPPSRTPSPPLANNTTSGRVSPFRGRGFRPGASSRHTTPSTSPPPPILPSDNNNNDNNNSSMNSQQYYEDQTIISKDDYINSSTNDVSMDSNAYRQQSRIPRVSRQPPQQRDKFLLNPNQINSSITNQSNDNNNMLNNNNNLSRSLSSLPGNKSILRPPPSPRRNVIKPSQLSPIIGTPKMSPETMAPPNKSILKPSKSAFVLLSKDETSSDDSRIKSPSKIPRSTSLNRLSSQSTENLAKTEPRSRGSSRNQSPVRKPQSRLQSREPSPNSKPPIGSRRTTNKNSSSIVSNNKSIGPNITSTAKSHIARTSSMKNLLKPKNVASNRSTSPSNNVKSRGPSPNRSSRLSTKSINEGSKSLAPSRSTSPVRNSRSRGPSPNRSNKSTIQVPGSLGPSRSTSPSNKPTNKLTPKPTSRGPSPSRLTLPRERLGNRSRDPSPNKNQKTNPKSPTKIPIKSVNSYKNVVSKIDSNNKRGNGVQNKPKIAPKPGVDTDSNHKSKNREPKLSRQMSRDKNVGKVNKPNDKSKLLKSSSSKKLLNLPGNDVTSTEDKSASNTSQNDDRGKEYQNENTNERYEMDEDGNIDNNENEENSRIKPTPTLATLIAQNFDTNANNVVSVTTETATAPLHIEAPKPQIPVAPIENLLSKPVADKTESKSNTTKSENTTDAAVPSSVATQSDKTNEPSKGNKSPPKPLKTQPQVSNTVQSSSENTKKSEDVSKLNQDSNDSVKNSQSNQQESKILSKKNSEKNIENSINNKNSVNNTVITHGNSIDKNSMPGSNNTLQTFANNNKPIIVSDKIKPIQIQVKEKGTNLDVQSGNVERRPSNGTITGNAEPRLPSSNITHAADSTTEDNNDNKKKSICGRLFSCCNLGTCCSRCRKTTPTVESTSSETSPGCFSCCRKVSKEGSVEAEPIVADRQRMSNVSDETQASTESNQRTCCTKFKDLLCCSRKNKVSDLDSRRTNCCSRLWCCGRKPSEDSWAERRDSILSEAPPRKCCPSSCWPFCRRKSDDSGTEPDSRRTSMLDKKKSLSPSTTVQPAEKKKPSLDESLVEHTSEMRGAIPVLPVPLAWICLVINCLLPGMGTILSGIFCLCFGKPRFSVHDGVRPRLGSFIINLIVGLAQLFCVLFCLVGWGWSIWWGVIMLKVARKHKKIKASEVENADEIERVPTATNVNHNGPDVERGRT